MGVMPKQAQLMLQVAPLCCEHEHQTIATLIQIAEVLYGVKPDNLIPDFWNMCFKAITERFSKLTILDLQNAFNCAQIEKKDYLRLTRDELLNPISEYWKKKGVILMEVENFRRKEVREIEAINQQKKFEQNSKELYLKSLGGTVFLGDEFEAWSIAKRFSHILSPERKTELATLAKNEYKIRLDKEGDNFMSTVPNWEKIYSKLFLNECVKKNVLFIEI
jgi:hypothetical protein